MEQTTIKPKKSIVKKSNYGGTENNKFTFDGKGKEDAVETLNKFLRECNEKDYGRKVTLSDIIARGIRKLDEKDIGLLQDQSMGLKDTLKHKYKQEKGTEASDDEFVRWLLEEYQQPKNKKKLN